LGRWGEIAGKGEGAQYIKRMWEQNRMMKKIAKRGRGGANAPREVAELGVLFWFCSLSGEEIV